MANNFDLDSVYDYPSSPLNQGPALVLGIDPEAYEGVFIGKEPQCGVPLTDLAPPIGRIMLEASQP